jgi:peptidoglycan/xylan/chitin deacetylase (PgdA/CDA1 family)
MTEDATVAERFHFADFTRANYRRLVRLAREKYPVRTFSSFDRNERFILWRHDVDFSMHAALRLARIEAEEGVKATYFINIHSEFYNAFERDVSDRVRDIIALGHELGVHFDATYYDVKSEAALDDLIAREARMLADTFGRPPAAVAFHNPTIFGLECDAWSYGGLVNTYARYFRTEVGYCSDSNGYWRHRRLEDVLNAASDPRLQVLTHDGWWQDEPMAPLARVERCIAGRAEKTRELYRELFRQNPDRVNVAEP